MAFAKSVWRLLVAIKDGLVLVLLLLFFGALYAALSARPAAPQLREGALLIDMKGAVVEEFEDTGLFGQVIDWGRCLQIELISQKVAEDIQARYTEAAQKRTEHLHKRLEEGILESEAALILGGDPTVKIPDGIERFLISPPELDALERWVKQTNEAIRQQMAEEQARAREARAAQSGPAEQPGTTGDDGGGNGSGLWTPGS